MTVGCSCADLLLRVHTADPPPIVSLEAVPGTCSSGWHASNTGASPGSNPPGEGDVAAPNPELPDVSRPHHFVLHRATLDVGGTHYFRIKLEPRAKARMYIKVYATGRSAGISTVGARPSVTIDRDTYDGTEATSRWGATPADELKFLELNSACVARDRTWVA